MRKTKLAVILVLSFLLYGCFGQNVVTPNAYPVTEVVTNYASIVPNLKSYDPNFLVLVNRNTAFNPEFLNTIEFVHTATFEGEDIQLERLTYDNYVKLQKRLLMEGIEIGIREGYRTVEEQQEVFDYYVNTKGYDYAYNIAAQPGYSEHHTGLAIDILPKIEDHWEPLSGEYGKVNTMYGIIHPILHEYGFILRYPKGKEYITGYNYESWHIRYVGKKVATEIYNNGWTLEEYYTAHSCEGSQTN